MLIVFFSFGGGAHASPQGHLFFFLGGNLPPKSNLSRVGATESNLEKKTDDEILFFMQFSKNTKAIFIANFYVFLFFLPKPPCPGIRLTRIRLAK